MGRREEGRREGERERERIGDTRKGREVGRREGERNTYIFEQMYNPITVCNGIRILIFKSIFL